MATAFALKAHMGVGYTPGADVKDVSTIYMYNKGLLKSAFALREATRNCASSVELGDLGKHSIKYPTALELLLYHQTKFTNTIFTFKLGPEFLQHDW